MPGTPKMPTALAGRIAGRSVSARMLAALWLTGCGGTPAAFGPMYPDNQQNEISALLARLDSAGAPKSAPVAIGAAPGQLYAYDLPGARRLWQHTVALRSAPQLAGDTVVVQVADRIVGYDLRTGEERFDVDSGPMLLKGAAGDGDRTAFVISQGQGTSARSEILLLRDGSIAWRRAFEGLGGVPAIAGDVVLVPWNMQFCSALELDSGREIARMRVQNGVISHVLNASGNIFLGSYHRLVRLTESIASARLPEQGQLEPLAQALPGRPLLLPDVYDSSKQARLDSAEHRIGLAYTPVPAGADRVALQDGNLYLFFYRFIFALDPATAALRWVHVHPSEIVGAAAQPHGLLFGDERGGVTLLAARSGEPVWHADTGIQSSLLRFPAEAIGSARAGVALESNVLRARLLAAIDDPDARLAPARVFAVEQLARFPEAAATADLVVLCNSDPLTPPVRDRACSELKSRPNGREAVLKELQRHAGYLEGTTSPQVGALATAAASLKLSEAAPLLVSHLEDPATRGNELPALVIALGDLGDARAGEGLAKFLARYHADPIDPGLVHALELVPAVLVKLRSTEARPMLSAVAADELGIYSVRQQARVGLETLTRLEAAMAAQRAAPAAEPPEESPPAAEAPEDASAVPARLTTPMVDEVLLTARDPLKACLSGAPGVVQARILLVIKSGRAATVSVVPPELQSCIEPIIRAQTFPETLAQFAEPERVTYTLRR
jgi:outer membrane protein assembly factor BamB